MDVLDKIKATLLEKFSTDTEKTLVEQSMDYVRKKALEEKDGRRVYSFSTEFLTTAISECIQNGFALDGINYVISGNRMYMPTYKAFKNKIYMVYPESEIDVQVVHKGDTYSFAKESGSVIYSHSLADPFESDSLPIVGAYCVIKNKRGEFLETLNRKDYEQMRDGSKQPKLWDKWESEFWKKSVIKRACKTHFNDITSAIEEKDNEVIGLADIVKASDDKKAAIIAAIKGDKDGDQDTRDQAE